MLLTFHCITVSAQDKPADPPPPPPVDHSYKPLTVKLSDDGNKYVRFIIWNQVWVRYTRNDPGTAAQDGSKLEDNFDIGMRRLRFLAYAQISPRFLILTHIGINNQTFVNGGVPLGGATGNASNQSITVDTATGRGTLSGVSAKKPQIFFHDIWNEFMVVDKKFYIGFGLHYWNGISRLTSHSTLNFMTLDAPIFNWPLIELNDQFARQMGIYTKGQIGRLDYRFALNRPFSVNTTIYNSPNLRTSHVFTTNYAFTGYVNWMFKDTESNKLPFFVGSYLGAKKVFNIGAGFYHHPQSTQTIENGVARKNDITLLGVDIFYDTPINKEKGSCLSIYSVFYNYDFGKNYIRNIGIMNEGEVPPSGSSLLSKRVFNGVGNAQPTIATGSIWYTQVGYALPKNKKGTQFMPYFTTTFKNFDFLEPSWQYDLGLNYFINAHHAKITLQYSQRPIFGLDGKRVGERGEFILQTHIFL